MSKFRPVWVEIDLSAIVHNVNSIQKKLKSKNTKIIAVVKTNAYGHGILKITETLLNQGINFFGVTSIDEGLLLRQKKINASILILGSLYPFNNFREVIEYNFIPTISSIDGIKQLNEYSKKFNKKTVFHLKIDTGMGRIGISPDSVNSFIESLYEYKNVVLGGIYTHFASADSNKEYTEYQLNNFKKVISNLRRYGYSNVIIHTANSAALLKYPESYYDMVRPGLCIYGLLPFPKADKFIDIRPALSWRTKVVFLKKVTTGKSISYGNTFITKKDSIIATIPVGYGDGYNRSLSNRAQVLIKGHRCRIVGRVTMDMTMIDVTELKNIRIGDEVILIGKSGNDMISVEEIASIVGTINYEIVCNIHTRVERVYKNG